MNTNRSYGILDYIKKKEAQERLNDKGLKDALDKAVGHSSSVFVHFENRSSGFILWMRL